MYTLWIKVDETLPWIELKGEYQTRRAARKAAENFLSNVNVKIAKVSGTKERITVVAAAKTT